MIDSCDRVGVISRTPCSGGPKPSTFGIFKGAWVPWRKGLIKKPRGRRRFLPARYPPSMPELPGALGAISKGGCQGLK